MAGITGVASDTFSDSPYYRRDSFRRGLARLGYAVGRPPKERPEPNDVLLIWNRTRGNHDFASRYEKAGARVLVAENGYIGKDRDGHRLYALALGHHLGAGAWVEGAGDRWAPLGIDLLPWRAHGDEIVILPQRGIGEPGIAMPSTWVADVVRRLKEVTDRPIRIRPHPGKDKTDPGPDLQNAWAAVTWASGAGIKSIVAGIPVFHDMPTWIGGPAAKRGVDEIENPFLGDRLPMLRSLAWAQFSTEEIESGLAFRALLNANHT